MARDTRIDTVKGLLIIGVILIHIILALDNVNLVNHAILGFFYIFAMPLFILISGMFSKDADEQQPADMWRSVANLFITLLIFQFLAAIRQHFIGISFISIMLKFPYGAQWYLMSLIYWRILLYYSPKWLLKRPMVYLSLALVVSLLCGLSRLGTFLSIQRTLNYYFFFLLGYYYRQGALSMRWWNNNTLHISVAIVMMPLLMWLYPRCGNILNGADHHSLGLMPCKIMIVICSVAMSLLVFNVTRYNKVLCTIGKDSLFYYLYHMFLIYAILVPLVVRFSLPRTFPFILLYIVAILFTLFLMSKIAPFRWLIRPMIKRPTNTDKQ